MSLLKSAKLVTSVLAEHPALLPWYLRNRLRVATLGAERSLLAGLSRFARGVTLKPTYACNLRCKMCRFAQSGDVLANPKEHLPLETWLSVIDDLARFSPYVTVSGGEPLIYPDIGPLLARIKQRNMRCALVTNGTLLTRRLDVLAESPPDIVIVSLDGGPEIHNRVRGHPTAYQRAVAGIGALLALSPNGKHGGPLTVINSSITPHNYLHLEQMMDIAQEVGVPLLNYQHQWSLTPRMISEHNALCGAAHRLSPEDLGAVDPPPVDPDEVAETVTRLRQRARRVRGRLVVTFHPNLKEREVRRWYADPHLRVRRRPAVCAWMNASIVPNGDVEPCFAATCGNVTEEPFSRIWNNGAFRDFRKQLARAGDLPICSRCCAYFRRD